MNLDDRPKLVSSGVLTLGAAPYSGPPNHIVDAEGVHSGYEPAIAEALGEVLGVPIVWEHMEWPELYPALDADRIDAVLYNQGILPNRREVVDFTRPYGLYNESVLVNVASPVKHPDDLRGRRVGAVRNTTNTKLARAFEGAEVVDFDRFPPMLDAVRSGEIDALVDDELYLGPMLGGEFRLAFTVPTKVSYGIAVKKGNPLGAYLDEVVKDLIESGELEAIWKREIVVVPFQRPEEQPERDVADITRIIKATVG